MSMCKLRQDHWLDLLTYKKLISSYLGYWLLLWYGTLYVAVRRMAADAIIIVIVASLKAIHKSFQSLAKPLCHTNPSNLNQYPNTN